MARGGAGLPHYVPELELVLDQEVWQASFSKCLLARGTLGYHAKLSTNVLTLVGPRPLLWFSIRVVPENRRNM